MLKTATADEPDRPRVLVHLDVGEYVIGMRKIEALGEAQIMRAGEQAGRPLIDRVRENLRKAAEDDDA